MFPRALRISSCSVPGSTPHTHWPRAEPCRQLMTAATVPGFPPFSSADVTAPQKKLCPHCSLCIRKQCMLFVNKKTTTEKMKIGIFLFTALYKNTEIYSVTQRQTIETNVLKHKQKRINGKHAVQVTL